MADVIPFAPRRRASSQGGAASGPLGQILFFTGVRYEREREQPAAEPARRPRPASRGERETRRRRPG
jgi:hypothetical protein